VESVNGKKYILVIVDDYSRFTWVKFLHSKDETPMFIIKFLKMIQNRSIVRLRHGKTPYELMHGKQPDLSFFHVFGALCYPTNDSENIGKLQPKADIGIFIGYAATKKAFRIYNRRTRRIVETIHVDFNELTAMASEQSSLGPALQEMIPGVYYQVSKNDPEVGISHETSVARSPQQNGVVERRNRTLIKAARTMLICSQAPLFLWAEAVETACFTQNRSIIRLRHGKTPYELLHSKLPDLSFFHVFGALCYPTNDSENLGKLQPKADIGILIGYALTKKAFRIYNRRTRRIIETIHFDFDELTAMASEHSSSGPALNDMTPGTISLGHECTSSSSTSYVPPSRNDWDLLFQPMFDDLLNPPLSVVNQAAEVIAPIAEVIP
nr:retrovirus-related Pol polyprotein from transposon TNT 1-94 [Tanacetum cinerariifolium]